MASASCACNGCRWPPPRWEGSSMVARADYEDVSSFSALLPHGLLVDPAGGVLLLSTPRWSKPTLALGCAWCVEPRNVEIVDESVCLDMARVHESLLRSLPVGAALQVIMTIVPTATVPAWELLRQGRGAAPVVAAQQGAIHAGMPHQDGTTPGRLRQVQTVVT